MWYEIIPVFSIMTGLMAAPPVFAYFVHKFFQNGNPCRRTLQTELDRRLYLRDVRINGSAYVLSGLEAIPDE